MKITGKMKDGSSVVVLHDDKGDAMPAFDQNGTSYPAYTTLIELYDTAGKKTAQAFVQVDKRLADATGDAMTMRFKEDMAHLDEMGVDVKSILEAA